MPESSERGFLSRKKSIVQENGVRFTGCFCPLMVTLKQDTLFFAFPEDRNCVLLRQCGAIPLRAGRRGVLIY